MKRILFTMLLGGTLAATTGCGLLQAVFYGGPCCGRGGCGSVCDDECGTPCRPLHRPVCGRVCASRAVDCCDGCDSCDECGPVCGRPCRVGCGCGGCGCASCNTCCDPCADPCGNGCYGRCWYRGPLSCLFALLTPRCWCGPNCGERYWGDFYSDPPDCWDPCDCQGNYTGGGCQTCGMAHNNGVSDATVYHENKSGCRTCNRAANAARNYSNQSADNDESLSDDEVVSQNDRVVSPAKKPTEPHRATRPQ